MLYKLRVSIVLRDFQKKKTVNRFSHSETRLIEILMAWKPRKKTNSIPTRQIDIRVLHDIIWLYELVFIENCRI